MPKRKRDYKKEYRDYHGKQSEIDKRNNRNKARRKVGLKKGDGKEVDHKDGNANNNSRSNLRTTKNKRAHRRQGGKARHGKR